VNHALQVTLRDLELAGTGKVRSCNSQLMLFTTKWRRELASSGIFENLLKAQVSVN
jgi:hypothetical protein